MEGVFVPFCGHSGFRYKLLHPSFLSQDVIMGSLSDVTFFSTISNLDQTNRTLEHYTLINYTDLQNFTFFF